MRNNTNSYSPKATPLQILGELDGSNLGSQQKNKKPIVRRCRLEKANLFFKDNKYGLLTGLTIAGKILQHHLVFTSAKFGGVWKEPGVSTITIRLAKWIDEGKLPNIVCDTGISDAGTQVQTGSKLISIDQARTMLLNQDNWDLKLNVPNWEKHKIVRGRRRRKSTRVPNQVSLYSNDFTVLTKEHWIIKLVKFFLPWTK